MMGTYDTKGGHPISPDVEGGPIPELIEDRIAVWREEESGQESEEFVELLCDAEEELRRIRGQLERMPVLVRLSPRLKGECDWVDGSEAPCPNCGEWGMSVAMKDGSWSFIEVNDDDCDYNTRGPDYDARKAVTIAKRQLVGKATWNHRELSDDDELAVAVLALVEERDELKAALTIWQKSDALQSVTVKRLESELTEMKRSSRDM